jgi:hypothetical protein
MRGLGLRLSCGSGGTSGIDGSHHRRVAVLHGCLAPSHAILVAQDRIAPCLHQRRCHVRVGSNGVLDLRLCRLAGLLPLCWPAARRPARLLLLLLLLLRWRRRLLLLLLLLLLQV